MGEEIGELIIDPDLKVQFLKDAGEKIVIPS
jgi:hypothetical protein